MRIRLIAALLFFFAVPGRAWAELPVIAPGFYKVRAMRGEQVGSWVHSLPMGSMVYLYNKTVADRDSQRGVRGVFGYGINNAEIQSRLSAQGEAELSWKFRASLSPGEGPLRILKVEREGADRVFVEFRQDASGRVERYVFEYYKKRLTNESTAIIAHRGAGYLPNHFEHIGAYPTNTIPGLIEGLRWGYDGVELDVRLSRDGRLVVAHDDQLRRVSNCDGRISRSDWESIRHCMISGSSLIPEASAGEAPLHAPISDLKSTIKAVLPLRVTQHLIIDVKPNDQERLKVALGTELEAIPTNLLGKVIVLTADLGLIDALKPRFPAVRFAIEDDTVGVNFRRINEYLLQNETLRAQGCGFDLISINIGVNFGIVQLLPQRGWSSIIQTAAEHGTEVLGWTVNTYARIKKLFRQRRQLRFLLSDAPIDTFARVQFDLIRDPYGESYDEIRERERRLMVNGGVRIDQSRRYDSQRP